MDAKTREIISELAMKAGVDIVDVDTTSREQAIQRWLFVSAQHSEEITKRQQAERTRDVARDEMDREIEKRLAQEEVVLGLRSTVASCNEEINHLTTELDQLRAVMQQEGRISDERREANRELTLEVENLYNNLKIRDQETQLYLARLDEARRCIKALGCGGGRATE